MDDGSPAFFRSFDRPGRGRPGTAKAVGPLFMTAAQDRAVALLIRGTPVSRGIAHGTAFVLACSADYAAAQHSITPAQVVPETARLKEALARAHEQLQALQKNLKERLGPKTADLFNAQAMILKDPAFIATVAAVVKTERVNAESAILRVTQKYASALESGSDVYLRERGADIRDVGRRVLSLLSRQEGSELLEVPEGSILVADELYPSTTAHLRIGTIRGFATERGGKTSHAAILARSSALPAVTGLSEACSRINTGDYVIVDGFAGVALVNPRKSVIAEYEKLEAEFKTYQNSLKELLDLPARTRDGVDVTLLANIGKTADAESAVLFKADGVGLYRTEFGFLIRPEFPKEDEQVEMARRVAERFAPRPVVFRLLDIGSDKNLPYFPLPKAANPALGERGIRLLLKHPDILRLQLRALLRVSAELPVSVLLPMVGGIEDIAAARAALEEAKASLKAEGKAFDPGVRLGAMIETPGAALLAPQLARAADFLSLGTNDLVQYTLAAGREDPAMESYYDPLHPAVLSLIARVCEAARAADKPLSICGDIAGDPQFTALLIGLGLRSFSVAPGELLEIKNAVRFLDSREAEALAKKALAAATSQEVAKLLQRETPAVPVPAGKS